MEFCQKSRKGMAIYGRDFLFFLERRATLASDEGKYLDLLVEQHSFSESLIQQAEMKLLAQLGISNEMLERSV